MFTVHTVDAIGTPNERLVQSKLRSALKNDGLMNVNSIRVAKNCVTVVLNAKPSSVSDQTLLKSAAHAIVQEELHAVEFRPDVIMVHLARGSDTHELRVRASLLPYKQFYDARPATASIDLQLNCVSDFVSKACENMIRYCLDRAIYSLPWRNEKEMRALVDPLTSRAMVAYVTGLHDPLLSGCVDEILPSPEVYLAQLDYTHLVQQVSKYMGEPPKNRLHFYESVYYIVTHEWAPLETTCILFDAVFHNMWDDYLLDEEDFLSPSPEGVGVVGGPTAKVCV